MRKLIALTRKALEPAQAAQDKAHGLPRSAVHPRTLLPTGFLVEHQEAIESNADGKVFGLRIWEAQDGEGAGTGQPRIMPKCAIDAAECSELAAGIVKQKAAPDWNPETIKPEDVAAVEAVELETER